MQILRRSFFVAFFSVFVTFSCTRGRERAPKLDDAAAQKESASGDLKKITENFNRVTADRHAEKYAPSSEEVDANIYESEIARAERWIAGPDKPSGIGGATRPRVVLLTASWCQWCRVLEHDVLPSSKLDAALARYDTFEVDVDAKPRWLDIPGFEGLPTFVFFDPEGRHVLTKGGYREADELQLILNVSCDRILSGKIEPYVSVGKMRRLGRRMVPETAALELARLEKSAFISVNSQDGGFLSPARHPYPDMLLALEQWSGHPARVDAWIKLTIASTLRGDSPRLRGDSPRDMAFDAEDLRTLSRVGPEGGRRWMRGIELLRRMDAYRGLQDPFDHGVFRYASGPGWYHPHFERRAVDNLAWVLLLRARFDHERADKIAKFSADVFDDQGLFSFAQRSDPFYYRLSGSERRDLASPRVSRPWNLEVQARAARVFTERCGLLMRVPIDRWPRAQWTLYGEDENAANATPDAVGEFLLALASCERRAAIPKMKGRARALAITIEEHWEDEALPWNGRLFRLAAGICAAHFRGCARALSATEGLKLDLHYPPPFSDLENLAKTRRR